MPIRVIGLTNRIAPIEVREQFSFNAVGVEDALARWRQAFPEVEATLASTCNRTELYFAAERSELPSYEDVFPFLIPSRRSTSTPKLQFAEYQTYFQHFDELNAIKHLFSVASSLDSMILGEPQILSQLKRAYEIAVKLNSTGPILNTAFQTAFKTAKRISVETEIFRRRVSVPSVAVVDFVLNIFERLEDKTTLLLGAGEMAEETLKYLVDYGARTISVANRSAEKAQNLADTWGGTRVEWNARMDALVDADLAICATGATEPIISYEDYLGIERKRKSGRPLFILDLAVPRNVDAHIGERPNVYLYSVDDLEAVCSHNKELRDKEIPKAAKIVDEEAQKCMADVNVRKSIDAIRALRNSWNDVKQAELERLLNRIECDDHTKEEIRYSFDRLVNKLLHSPTVSLRDASQGEGETKLVDALRKLFRF